MEEIKTLKFKPNIYVEQIYCPLCDKYITKSNFTKHCKTKKHMLKTGQAIPEIKNDTIHCVCGSIIKKNSTTHHNRSNKHTLFMKNKYQAEIDSF